MEQGKLNYPTYKTERVNRTQTMRFYPFVFTGKERDEETGYGTSGNGTGRVVGVEDGSGDTSARMTRWAM